MYTNNVHMVIQNGKEINMACRFEGVYHNYRCHQILAFTIGNDQYPTIQISIKTSRLIRMYPKDKFHDSIKSAASF